MSIEADHSGVRPARLWRRWIGHDAPATLSPTAWIAWALWAAWFSLDRRIKNSVVASFIILGGSCALALAFALMRPLGAEPVVLFQDLTPKPGEALLAGIFSTVLNLVNAGFAGAALFTAFMARPFLGGDARVRFLAVGGLILVILAADDALMLHERVLPPLIHTTDEIVLWLMAMSGLAAGLAFLRVILRHGGGVLALAVLPVLAVTLLSDAGLFPDNWEFVELLEEAGEIFVTLSWGWLLAIVSREVIRDLAARGR